MLANKEWGDTHDVHIGKSKIKLNMYVAITNCGMIRNNMILSKGLKATPTRTSVCTRDIRSS